MILFLVFQGGKYKMLINGKTEDLMKYSKGSYDKERFILKTIENWELTEKQRYMTYLIADLAVNANGVFSVSNNSFREMFERRFKMTVSRSTVIRFFQLLEELGLLTVHEARRKNRKQSANIFIMEPIKNENEILHDTPDETPEETLNDTLNETHNIDINIDLNIDSNISLNNIVNNLLTSKQEIIDNLILEYMNKGLSKQVCFMVLKEVERNPDIKNFGAYFRTALENTLYRHNVKHGYIDPYERFKERVGNTKIPFYNWLEDDSDDEDEFKGSFRNY